jgi:AraC family ethanolamine operon transcriptional activator
LKKRQRIVQGAESIMSGALDEPLRIEAICEQLQISRRTLFYAFQSRLKMTPLDFFKALRLSEGHRLLFRTQRSIRDIAGSVGYHHQGRFAMDYRERFGVKPSDARRPESAMMPTVEPIPLALSGF